MRQKPGQEEVKWEARQESPEERKAMGRELAAEQAERAWQIWVRVKLGGEQRIEVAREYGYREGSAVTQALKRLEAAVQTQPVLAGRMKRLRRGLDDRMSSVKT